MAGAGWVRRRGVLRGAAIIVGSGLAGCSDAGDGTASTDEPTPSEPEPYPPAVYAGVDDALVALEAAQTTYADEIDKLEESLAYVAFETGPMRGDIEAARAHLDRAEEAAEGDPPAGIATLRAITDYFERLVEALTRYNDGLGRLETAELYAENDRLEDGEAEAQRAVDALEETAGTVEAAEATRLAIDLEPLTGLIEASPAQVRLSLEETAALGNELFTYASGLAFYVRGTVDYIVGLDHYVTGVTFAQEDALADAITEFETAQARFEAAQAESSAGEEVAPVPLLERFLVLTCTTGHFADAAGHLIDAVQARMDGDEAAEQAAFEAWNQAEMATGAC